MYLSLNEAKIAHIGNLMNKSHKCGFLIVGEEVTTSTLSVQPIGDGHIDGFVYWFEMMNTLSSEAEASSSGSELEATEVLFKMSTLKNELCRPKKSDQYHHTFDSFSRDSPINQCVVLFDEPLTVSSDQCLPFCFSSSEMHFLISA